MQPASRSFSRPDMRNCAVGRRAGKGRSVDLAFRDAAKRLSPANEPNSKLKGLTSTSSWLLLKVIRRPPCQNRTGRLSMHLGQIFGGEACPGIQRQR